MVLMWLGADHGWGVLLNGAIGGFAGAAVTGLAVWLTLKSERKRTREEELRGVVLKLHAATARFLTDSRATDPVRAAALFKDARLLLDLAIILTPGRSPLISELATANTLSWLSDGEGIEAQVEFRRELCSGLAWRLSLWLSKPGQFAATLEDSALTLQLAAVIRRRREMDDALGVDGEGASDSAE